MTTKFESFSGLSKDETKYLPLIDKYLTEIKAIHKDMSRRRANGRKIIARIDRNLKTIQTTIDRVASTL